MRITLVCCVLFLLVACNSSTPAPTAAPVDAPVVEPTDTPEPAVELEAEATQEPEAEPTNTQEAEAEPESIPFDSGGLGQPRDWWEANYGAGESDGFLFTKHGDYDLLFSNDNAAHIERQWEDPLPADDARFIAETLMPADAVHLETYSPEGRPETTVHLYRSELLAERFGDDDFIGGEPGEFIILYSTFDAGVSRIILGIGNNP